MSRNNKIIPALLIALLLGVSLIFPIPAYAFAGSDAFNQACNGISGSELCDESRARQKQPGSDGILGPSGVLSKVVQLVVAVVGIASVIMIIVGGMKYVLSSGDSNQTASAKNTVLYAVIGLVVAVMAQAIVIFVIKKV